jgi:hypothetical protein
MCAVPPTRRPGCAGFAVAPAATRRRSRWVFRKNMEIHIPDPYSHRDALTRITRVECAIIEMTRGSS